MNVERERGRERERDGERKIWPHNLQYDIHTASRMKISTINVSTQSYWMINRNVTANKFYT